VIYIGIDDTDNLESRGTGRLARGIAATLSERYHLLGVTRHQLLVDPRVPYTSHNSSAAIRLSEDGDVDLAALADAVGEMMLADFQAGSDPGLCVARVILAEVSDFGRRAKVELVFQSEAHALAARAGCILRGLGGTRDGVIGALAATGLAATGNDGRFLLAGTSRDLQGMQKVSAIVAHGIAEVRSMDGGQLSGDAVVQTNGKLRPAFREGRPILFVQPSADDATVWTPVKLD